MRSLRRLNKPEILVRKESIWLQRFLNSGTNRPPSATYRHQDILSALHSTSFYKCFYCETILKGIPSEVDHHIEVSCDRNLAFTWENLYLACDNCNNKINNTTIPVIDALDPCVNTDNEIQENLCFENEQIQSKNNSELGRRTITKYKLNTLSLDYLRARELIKFHVVLDEIKSRCINETRTPSDAEILTIKSFSYNERSYSLMFLNKLAALNLL